LRQANKGILQNAPNTARTGQAGFVVIMSIFSWSGEAGRTPLICSFRERIISSIIPSQPTYFIALENSYMNTCRHCGEEIRPVEFKPLIGRKRSGWVHTRNGEEPAYRCLLCGHVGLASGGHCANCHMPQLVIEHLAEP
jgi:hypothetical protein